MKNKIQELAFIAWIAGVVGALLIIVIVASPYILLRFLYFFCLGKKDEALFGKYEYHQM